MSVSKLSTIAQVVQRYNIKAKKSLGQNFIYDPNLIKKIVQSMGNLSTHDVIEIGPGPGSLTHTLLKFGARRLVVIEKDPQFLEPLKEISKSFPGKLKIINHDILLFDPKALVTPPVKIVSNLPYNIGTKILLNLITSKSWPPYWDSLTLMFQKEVADRILSGPNTKSYGRLSIISQWRSNIKLQLSVQAKSFIPIPKVDSSVLQFTPNKVPNFFAPQERLETVVRVAFAKRRKMLRHSLKEIDPNIQTIIENTGINPTSRPEELSIEQFCRLAVALK